MLLSDLSAECELTKLPLKTDQQGVLQKELTHLWNAPNACHNGVSTNQTVSRMSGSAYRDADVMHCWSAVGIWVEVWFFLMS